MFGNEGLDLRLHGVGQQPSSTRAQYRRQWILGRNLVWMGKRNNRIFVHGISFLLGNRRPINRQDTPPLHHAITRIQP